MRLPFSLFVLGLAAGAASAQSNWVDFVDETSTRLVLTSIPLNDAEEKDMVAADFDNDGDKDVAIVRKIPFSNPGGLINVLLMNENGVLVDRTSTLGADFGVSDDCRDVLAFDSNNDGWVDLCNANTFGEQPRLFINQGESGGVWQGFAEDTGFLAAPLAPGSQVSAPSTKVTWTTMDFSICIFPTTTTPWKTFC